jgi:threonyl-tRNA synthetase
MLVVGDKEAEQGTVSVRLRSGADLGSLPVATFVERLRNEVKSRTDTVQ